MAQDTLPTTAPSPADEGQWVVQLRRLVDEGQCFLAYDHAQEALQRYPDSRRIHLLAALSLVRSGAVAEGRRLLAPLKERLDSHEGLARDVLASARRLLPTLDAGADEAEALRALSRLAGDLVKLGSADHGSGAEDHETLQLLAQVFFETWRAAGDDDDLVRARNTFLRSFRGFDDRPSGIDAALTSWLLGDRESAAEVAEALLAQPPRPADDPETRFRQCTALGELHLLSGDRDRALAAYREAIALGEVRYPAVVAARERLELLTRHGLEGSEELFALLRLPVVVVFAGQPLDRPGQPEALFPAHLEDAVKGEIRQRLDDLGADIGYCSAACGADLLFIEAMLERDGEVHVFLPCAIDDFIATRVAYAGRRWEQRLRTALKQAATVSFATEERYLGHDILFRFNNQVIDGMARLRAALLGTRPYLVLVWDYAAESAAGTAADFMDHWADIARLRLIDLDAVRSTSPLAAPGADDPEPPTVPAPQCTPGPERVIRAMLFADIVGFSKLAEEDLPRLWDFLTDLKTVTDRSCHAPDLVESWGDALYVVMPTARAILDYSFTLQAGFESMSAERYGLAAPLRLRVGLHAGPVYEGTHPLTGKPIIYGSHVSRTARIEPVTVPGQIYGSQQFVALLTAEESELRNECEMTGGEYRAWFGCDYLGNQPLAKKYGRQPVYLLRPFT